jgi:hypothetical protein
VDDAGRAGHHPAELRLGGEIPGYEAGAESAQVRGRV